MSIRLRSSLEMMDECVHEQKILRIGPFTGGNDLDISRRSPFRIALKNVFLSEIIDCKKRYILCLAGNVNVRFVIRYQSTFAPKNI